MGIAAAALYCLVLSSNLTGVFDKKVDLKDYEEDSKDLKKSLGDITQIIVDGNNGADLPQLMKSLEGLLGHQANVRSTYQTKTAPTAALVIDPKKIKYETIIGRGGRSDINIKGLALYGRRDTRANTLPSRPFPFNP